MHASLTTLQHTSHCVQTCCRIRIRMRVESLGSSCGFSAPSSPYWRRELPCSTAAAGDRLLRCRGRAVLLQIRRDYMPLRCTPAQSRGDQLNIACLLLRQSAKGKNSQKGPPLLLEWRPWRPIWVVLLLCAGYEEHLSVGCSLTLARLRTTSQQLVAEQQLANLMSSAMRTDDRSGDCRSILNTVAQPVRNTVSTTHTQCTPSCTPDDTSQ